MKLKWVFIFVLFLTLETFSQSQNNGAYTSTVMDDSGAPMRNVMVRVRGTGESVITNAMGEFTVNAKAGDVLIMSKDGKRITTITLNNSNFYQVENEAEQKADVKQKSMKKLSKQPRSSTLLDSAKLYSNTNPDKSIGFVEAYLKNNRSSSNIEQLSRAYVILGDVYAHIKQYDLAVSNYEMAHNINKTNVIKLKLAQAYTFNNNFEESTEMYNELLKSGINTNQKIIVYEGLGDNSSKKLNKLDEAIVHYQEGLKIAQQDKNTAKIADLNSKIGKSYSQKGDTEQAEGFFNNSLSISDDSDVKSRIRSTNSIADYYKESKNYDKEIELRKITLKELDSVEEFSDAEEYDGVENFTSQKLNLDIGNAYLNKGELKEAIPYFEKSIETASSVEDLETQKDALQRLSELYRSAGKSDKALEKYREYAELVDVLYLKKEQEIQDAVRLGKELTNKQNRINSLEKDRELSESRYNYFSSQKELTQENYRRQRLIIYSLLGGLLLLLFSLFWMYKSNKQRKLANNLLALKSLRTQMNPHFIFNALNSVNSYIAQNDERAANRYLTEFSTLMRSVLDNSEQDFIPLSKEIELLELYMKLEHSRFKDKFDYDIKIDDKLQISEFQIPPMLLQPYVENAVWHGLRYRKNKGKLDIYMRQLNNETIEITIADDGIGRKKSKELKTEHQQKQKSQGMNNIKKRIAILNEMHSDKVDVFIDDLHADNSGTKVVLTLKKD